MLANESYINYLNIVGGGFKLIPIDDVPDISNSKFYVYGFNHRNDIGHHGETGITGLVIESTFLDENSENPFMCVLNYIHTSHHLN